MRFFGRREYFYGVVNYMNLYVIVFVEKVNLISKHDNDTLPRLCKTPTCFRWDDPWVVSNLYHFLFFNAVVFVENV